MPGTDECVVAGKLFSEQDNACSAPLCETTPARGSLIVLRGQDAETRLLPIGSPLELTCIAPRLTPRSKLWPCA